MPIHAARDLQFRSDSVAARLYQERLYSSGPAGAIMHEVWLLVAQMPAEFGWAPRVSRTPLGIPAFGSVRVFGHDGRDKRMSRTSRGDQRLRFFNLGNDRCPICLTAFSEREAEQGEVVTLEHVPPRSFKVGGFAMCLTCADCNNSASRAESRRGSAPFPRDSSRPRVCHGAFRGSTGWC